MEVYTQERRQYGIKMAAEKQERRWHGLWCGGVDDMRKPFSATFSVDANYDGYVRKYLWVLSRELYSWVTGIAIQGKVCIYQVDIMTKGQDTISFHLQGSFYVRAQLTHYSNGISYRPDVVWRAPRAWQWWIPVIRWKLIQYNLQLPRHVFAVL